MHIVYICVHKSEFMTFSKYGLQRESIYGPRGHIWFPVYHINLHVDFSSFQMSKTKKWNKETLLWVIKAVHEEICQ